MTTFEKDLKHRQMVEDILSKLSPIEIPTETVYTVAGKRYFKLDVITRVKTRILLRDLSVDLHKNFRDNLEMILHKCGAAYKDFKPLRKADIVYIAESIVKFIPIAN